MRLNKSYAEQYTSQLNDFCNNLIEENNFDSKLCRINALCIPGIINYSCYLGLLGGVAIEVYFYFSYTITEKFMIEPLS